MKCKGNLYAGIDIGGTNIVAAVVKKNGRILMLDRITTPRPSTPSKVFTQAKKVLYKVFENAGIDAKSQICSLGIGIAAEINQRTRRVHLAPNLGWHNISLNPYIRKIGFEDNIPIYVDNDANACAWGAYFAELKQKPKSLICITLGTGVGGGIVLDGRVYHGFTGSAAEIGHIIVDPDGPRCRCGNRGCLEAYLGNSYLVARAKKSKHSSSLWPDGPVTPQTIQLAAEAGDKQAIAIWREVGNKLGIAITSLINVLNPEVICFAGGLSRAGSLLFGPMRRIVMEKAFPELANSVKFVVSRLGQNLGVVGTALLAFDPSQRR